MTLEAHVTWDSYVAGLAGGQELPFLELLIDRETGFRPADSLR